MEDLEEEVFIFFLEGGFLRGELIKVVFTRDTINFFEGKLIIGGFKKGAVLRAYDRQNRLLMERTKLIPSEIQQIKTQIMEYGFGKNVCVQGNQSLI